MQNIWWKMFCSHNTKHNACSTRSILSNGRQIHSTQYYDLHCIHDEAVRHQHRKSIWSTTTTKTPNQNETKTSANRHLTLLYMRHVTFMLIVEIQQRQRQKNKTKQANKSKIPYATHYVFDVCFHRSTPPLLLLSFLREGMGRSGKIACCDMKIISALYIHMTSG